MTFGEIGAARHHLRATTVMVELAGGPRAIGLSPLLERMYSRFLDWLCKDDESLIAACTFAWQHLLCKVRSLVFIDTD